MNRGTESRSRRLVGLEEREGNSGGSVANSCMRAAIVPPMTTVKRTMISCWVFDGVYFAVIFEDFDRIHLCSVLWVWPVCESLDLILNWFRKETFRDDLTFGLI